MSKIKIYTNENVPVAAADGLKRRGFQAWSARDSGNLGLGDDEQLFYACQEKAIIFKSFDDFCCANSIISGNMPLERGHPDEKITKIMGFPFCSITSCGISWTVATFTFGSMSGFFFC